jgi:hypothetical protein
LIFLPGYFRYRQQSAQRSFLSTLATITTLTSLIQALAPDPCSLDFSGVLQPKFESSLASHTDGAPLNTLIQQTSRKAQIDALLLKLPGVSARKISDLDAYFVSDKMFACISGNGVGLRVPAATATELQFSRSDVVPFQPKGMSSTREWVQIDRSDAADYVQDLELFRLSLEFVKGSRSR